MYLFKNVFEAALSSKLKRKQVKTTIQIKNFPVNQLQFFFVCVQNRKVLIKYFFKKFPFILIVLVSIAFE